MYRTGSVCVLLIVMLTAAAGLGAQAAETPRPLSAAERAACQFVSDYLASGPDAIVSRISPASRFAGLGQEALKREIGVRMGPLPGASWRLATVVPSLADRTAVFEVSFPSGIDDTVTMSLEKSGAAYQIKDLRVLAEPSLRRTVRPVRTAAGPAEEQLHFVPPLLGLFGLLLTFIAISAHVRSLRAGLALFALAGVLMTAGLWLTAVQLRDHEQQASVSANADTGRLGDLLEYRQWLLTGAADSEAPKVQLPQAGFVRDAYVLWSTQSDLQRSKLAEVAKVLDGPTDYSNIPLYHLVRARYAAIRSQETALAISYEKAINLGPGRDILWEEAAEQLSTAGYEDRSRHYLEATVRSGSRDPGAYYWLAAVRAERGDLDGAKRLIPTAWSLRPVKRDQLMSLTPFWEILRKPPISDLVSLSAATEPTIRDARLGTAPLSVPPTATATASGSFLRLEFGDREFVIPGGAELSPATASVMNAAEWAEHDEEKALRDVPALCAIRNKNGAMTQPLMRKRFVESAAALEDHNRWNELLSLTDAVSPESEHVPTEVMFTRGAALRRMGRVDEARALFLSLATNPVVKRKQDSRELWELGESFALLGNYDTAIKFMEKAASKREIPFLDDRIRQLLMNQRLATGYASEQTEHFELRYPHEADPALMKKIGAVLEAEIQRLRNTIPATVGHRITVNIVQWEEFRTVYTGSDYILGFYDGKLTLPIAGVYSLSPPVVSVMTHELAHALIAAATNDQAPRWFHEGLAQRVQMVEYSPNALNMYDDNQLISATLLDGVMSASPDPASISEAYIESETMVRYIEQECGAHAIASMLSEFRAGARSDDAVRAVCGKDIATFDSSFRGWGKAGPVKVFVNPPPIRYDLQMDDNMRRSAGR